MSDAKELGITPASAGTGTGGSVSLGKGAWCCDSNREIPPDKEVRLASSRRPKCAGSRALLQISRHQGERLPDCAAEAQTLKPQWRVPRGACWCDATGPVVFSQAEVFEEIATLEFQFEGIPTVPPRKDMEHFAFFCDGCRYRCCSMYSLGFPAS